MLASRARWRIRETNDDAVTRLIDELSLSPLLAKLLVARGMEQIEEVRKFLQVGAAQIHDPFLMDGIEIAVERIRSALQRQEFIRIYGDYDADGVSSTSLMVYLMRELGANFDYYIPHRIHEGYGLNNSALDQAKEHGVSLIITVDTGISAYAEVEYAGSLGIDVIVTDHHEPPEILPPAHAVINPKKPGCSYPFKQLAGVGVAFKLAHALLNRLPHELLEMVAIGTVADLMPLTDENRVLVKLGIDALRNSGNPGLLALFDAAGIERKDVSAGHIGFSLAPRINASGRLESAGDAVRLLTTNDREEADRLAFELDQLNKERQRIVEEMTAEALAMLEEGPDPAEQRVLIVSKEDWNAGVIGIVASKLLEKYYRPTIVLGIDPQTGIAKGSARSIAGFDLYKALTSCSDLFEHYGGHQAAAGMSIAQERIPELKHRLEALAQECLTEQDLLPEIQVDLCSTLEEATLDGIKQLEQLAPFGMGNPSPRVVFTGLELNQCKKMGREQQHLKLTLSQEAKQVPAMEAVGFGKSFMADKMAPSARIDVLGELSINEWNGIRKPQLIIQDLRIPEPQVFDWRGIRNSDDRWSSLFAEAAAVNNYGGGKQNTAFVVFNDHNYSYLSPGWITRSSIWSFADSGPPKPIHNESGHSYAEITDLILMAMPQQASQAEQALQQAIGVERVYAVFEDSSRNEAVIPGREQFKQVYAALLQQAKSTVEERALLDYISKRSGLPKGSIQFIIKVFEELSFVERDGTGYRCVASPVKKELSSSRLYRSNQERQRTEEMLLYSSAKELSRWVRSQLTHRI
ncbi:single-stranded-DNA-specific exonuclease RecJ [Paenibacillus sp. J2TS4]|uniref:single-stranded-DNA-specific exonuclease RecJ n=1 Tax=Paenibacillus sp. J2TS4 TaxID=2807194 RepID=UPI001B04B338|nr:single-stranded-DNA-specific exonuclease RecJ [Paenibacillus sp. J2TS4]GIP31404.1 single-stranded-DNA-specific exonuclease RecJ [Paenibacillus sp. J2TS4]